MKIKAYLRIVVYRKPITIFNTDNNYKT